ncbi:GGDEF domain-containing protein [Micromonospora sp. HM134]|uniref:GGDEF domain-containing protein n=1 Tax=Micromonospora sp. HM134 TaxID=2583243 RepID=UPI001198C803|nr:GGDEF domain-containing protein [Micromonospora sp. HM134]QDY06122.1 GGDEF domain-containing protein [Micromonospora sp. HM134]
MDPITDAYRQWVTGHETAMRRAAAQAIAASNLYRELDAELSVKFADEGRSDTAIAEAKAANLALSSAYGAFSFHSAKAQLHSAVLQGAQAARQLDGVAQLIAERDHYRHLALHDPLTGVYNRAGLAEHWQTVAAGERLGLVDLDRFKQVNDEHGHTAGDTVLVSVACQLARWGTVARLGGDEFVVVVRPETGALAALAPLWTVTLPGGQRIRVAGSIGWADVIPGDLGATLHRADAAMYRLKRRPVPARQGRRRVRDAVSVPVQPSAGAR